MHWRQRLEVQRCELYPGTPIQRAALLVSALLGPAGFLVAGHWVGEVTNGINEFTVEPPLIVAMRTPTLDVPHELAEPVDRWIQRYLTDQRRTFEVFLSRENVYGGLIRRELRNRGMPEDLLYLAMIESGFSTRATSPVEASGLWQFMGPTAREYGLEIDDWVDERRDPVRATDAALDYLERLHDRFGSWYLAAAAYNAGPERVARAIREVDGQSRGEYEVFWKISDRLPSETRDYVPKLLAAVLLAREAEVHGFEIDRHEPYDFEHVWVPGSTSLARVARALEMPLSELQALNPHLIRSVTPPGTTYGIRVPPDGAPTVVASLGREWRVADD